MIQKVETLVVGAGVIGSAVAMHLAKMGMTGIRVIDLDLEGALSSSELNAGGVRATWVQPIHIEVSKRSIEYFSTVADQVGYKACGYLWLHAAQRWDAALKARERQVEIGWPVEVWDIPELRRRVPWLDKTEGIAGAVFAPQDGLINPNLLKNHFRLEGRARGVIYDDRTLLREVKFESQGSHRIRVFAERFESHLTSDSEKKILTSDRGFNAEGISTEQVEYHAERIVNCAGPWAADVAEIIGYSSPSFPVRRQVCIFDCRDVDLSSYGMVVDTSGVYFHPEASNGLAGFANANEPRGKNFTYDGENFFMEFIWPALYERSTGFERLKHLTGWAGLYEVSPDEGAIVGCVEEGEPGKNGQVFEAHSFSGHGVMHSYAAGLGLAERILRGRYETLDLGPLSASRFEKGQLIHEKLVI